MNWFRKRRIAKLKIQLAGVTAADRCERVLANQTRNYYPMVLAANAKLIGEITETLRQLEEAPLPSMEARQ